MSSQVDNLVGEAVQQVSKLSLPSVTTVTKAIIDTPVVAANSVIKWLVETPEILERSKKVFDIALAMGDAFNTKYQEKYGKKLTETLEHLNEDVSTIQAAMDQLKENPDLANGDNPLPDTTVCETLATEIQQALDEFDLAEEQENMPIACTAGTQQVCHKTFIQQAYEEVKSLMNEIDALKCQTRGKEAELAALKSTLSECRSKLNDMETECNDCVQPPPPCEAEPKKKKRKCTRKSGKPKTTCQQPQEMFYYPYYHNY